VPRCFNLLHFLFSRRRARWKGAERLLASVFSAVATAGFPVTSVVQQIAEILGFSTRLQNVILTAAMLSQTVSELRNRVKRAGRL